MERNILFIIPDERKVYEDVAVKIGAFHLPSLAFAILGAIAKKNGLHPTILDLSLSDDSDTALRNQIESEPSAYVCLTCTSATYAQAVIHARAAKAIAPTTPVIIGGPHVSATVEETLGKGCFDYVFVGEADVSFNSFLNGVNPLEIEGCAVCDSTGTIRHSAPAPLLANLDDSPMPDYSLYDLSRYAVSKLQARRLPVVWIETSRGCPFDCQICNKLVYGRRFRPKSVDRVMRELEHLHASGIREFHIADDGFTTDMQRTERICDAIIERKMKISWSCVNGIRVDRVSDVLLRKMRKAGCYRISFGIESGNQEVLNRLGKKITLDQVRAAVGAARRAGMEVFGFFLLGCPDDTEETMRDTIRFAKELKLHLAKASIVVPFPGAPLYVTYKKMNLLLPDTQDYRYFNVYHTPTKVYTHPTLDWVTIERYYKKFYRRVYLNPGYIMRRLFFSLWRGVLLQDILAALSIKWFGK